MEIFVILENLEHQTKKDLQLFETNQQVHGAVGEPYSKLVYITQLQVWASKESKISELGLKWTFKHNSNKMEEL